MKKFKKIGFVCIAIVIIAIFLLINSSGTVTTLVSKINEIENAKEGQVEDEQEISGLYKKADFASKVPGATMIFDTSKADTTNPDAHFELISDSNRIQVVEVPTGENTTQKRIAYLGPDEGGVPTWEKGYVTVEGLVENATEQQKISFSIKFYDVVTARDFSKKDVLITISNIYIENYSSSEIVKYWIGWKGNGLAVYPCNNNFEVIDSEGHGMAMHCDISVKVLNKDNTPVENETLLLEVNDLDQSDKRRFSEDSGKPYQYPKAEDSRYNAGLDEAGKLALYETDYRESIYILNGAKSDAYMPSTNWLEVKRLSDGNNANGLRFSAYGENSDETHSLNSGFLVLVDSEESAYRWYGSLMNGGNNRDKKMGTVLFNDANSHNHWIKAKSSTGGNISNKVVDYADYNSETVNELASTDPATGGNFLHTFADGTTVTYHMNAQENHYLNKIKIDNVEFVPSDFSSVPNGGQKTKSTVTKSGKSYDIYITKNSQGQITEAFYVFANNDANHEIEVVWDGQDPEPEPRKYTGTVKFYILNTTDEVARPKTVQLSLGDKLKASDYQNEPVEDGYVYNSATDPVTITENEENNVLILYYVQETEPEPEPEPKKARYTVKYYYDGVEDENAREVHEAIVNTEISTYKEKNKTGYHKKEVEGLPLEINSDETKNVIKVYYEKEEEPKTGKVVIRYVNQDTGKDLINKEITTGTVGTEYTSNSKNIDGYTFVRDSGNTKGKITEQDTTVVFYYKAKNEEKKESKQAENEPASLPKTGGFLNNYGILIIAIAIIGMVFGFRYRKLKDIK